MDRRKSSVLMIAIILLVSGNRMAAAQLNVLYNFGATSTDGSFPQSGLIFDGKGNLYGTTSAYSGTVYELIPGTDGSWTEQVLYSFASDGIRPAAGVIFDAQGNLYGTTTAGGASASGTVYELIPGTGGSWTEKLLHSFGATSSDGAVPDSGLILDGHGNLYGVTPVGGSFGFGTVFELSPGTGGSWTEKVLWNFGSTSGDGSDPEGGLVFDASGNLYGTTETGGTNAAGIVYKLTQSPNGSWAETVLYTFGATSTDGTYPTGSLTFDVSGNLYGATRAGGDSNGGTVFELSPAANGSWAENILHNFGSLNDGVRPLGGLIFDAAGNLYGLTQVGGAYAVDDVGGTVFQLTPVSGGGWTENVLHSFKPFTTDGFVPWAGLIFDASGNLYGTTSQGGTNLGGIAFEISLTLTSPSFSLPAGTYPSEQMVEITDGTPNATIYYTTDGTTPTTSSTEYTGPITVPSTETIEAIAVASGYTNSVVAAATYIITSPSALAPVFTPGPGTYNITQAVSITDATSGATIYYTTNGTTPTMSSSRYTGPITVSSTETIEAIAIASGLANSDVVPATYAINTGPGSGLLFVPVVPCRIADTRSPEGPFSGPEPGAGSTRAFSIAQSPCGIPLNAAAYSLNVTVVPDASLNHLTIWPAGETQPDLPTLNSDGRIKAEAAIVSAGVNGGVSVYVSDATQVILDIDGYFVAPGTTTLALSFYPLTPCRIADTRKPSGPLGGPSISGGNSRNFTISGNCGIPSTAQAYSLNVTAVPHTTLNYLTTWPTGETQPYVSTLNSLTGAITANAAIVPAGSGDISIYASDTTDVVLDVNGYFAPPATGGLSLYTVTPCRVIDTRPTAFNGVLSVYVESSSCAPSATAQAYVLNATVVPPGALDYLTLWPTGESQPYVSTLNALDGVITSNIAIVSTTNRSIDAFAYNPTNLILDLSSYFAP